MSKDSRNITDLTKEQESNLLKHFETSKLVLNNFYPTEIEQDQLNIVFRIFDFHLLEKESGEYIKSRIFGMEKNPNIQWVLKVYPNGNCKKNEGYLSISLFLNPEDPNVTVKADLRILVQNANSDEQKRKFNFTRKFFDFKYKSWNVVRYISINELLNNTDLLPNNVLTILCSIKIDSSSKTWICSNPEKRIIDVEDVEVKNEIVPSKKRKLSPDSIQETEVEEDPSNSSKNLYETIFEDKCYADVTLIVDDHKIKAHKCILAASSPDFATMLKQTQNKKVKNTFTLPDLSYDAANEMLRFIYTKKVDRLHDIANDLIVAAHKYGLIELKELCVKYLCENINFDNALELIIIAEQHSAKDLKDSVFDFIIKNRKKFINNSKFQELNLSNPKLMQPLIQSLVSFYF